MNIEDLLPSKIVYDSIHESFEVFNRRNLYHVDDTFLSLKVLNSKDNITVKYEPTDDSDLNIILYDGHINNVNDCIKNFKDNIGDIQKFVNKYTYRKIILLELI